jgi:hypothetical protein
VILGAHGLRVELPAAWSGRIWTRAHDVATLHLANYAVSLRDGEFGDASTAAMAPGASFIALTEYRPGTGLAPGHGLFAHRRIPRRLDPAAFKPTGLAHPRPDQAGMQHFFTAAKRPFCLYVVLAGPRGIRRTQLADVDHVLSSLSIRPRG